MCGRYFTLYPQHAFDHGRIEVVENHVGLSAVAVWVDHHHDAIRLPQYLEASNQNSARLYRRHGYRDMTPCAIRLPDRPPFFRMWRTANV